MATDYTPFSYTLNIDIDLNKITDKQLHRITNANLARAMERGIDKGFQILEERVNDRLRQELSRYNISDSSVIGDISVRRIGNDGFEMTGVGEVVYVEFGTGYVAKQTSGHPNPKEWDGFMGYDVNKHGEKGWTYMEDGVYKHTRGQIPKPFMHNTWTYARQAFTGIIEGAINREIGKELGL